MDTSNIIHYMKVIQLRDFLNSIEQTRLGCGLVEGHREMKDAFLKQVPIFVNYIYNASNITGPYILYHFPKKYARSTTNLEVHIQIKGLTPTCKVGLSQEQYEQMRKLVN